MIMRSSPLQADKCFVFAFNNILAMQSLLDRLCFTVFAQGFCLLILESRASLGAKLGATLVPGGYRGSRSITLRGPLLKFAGQTLVCTELAMCDVRASYHSHVGGPACCLVVVIC